MSSAKGDDCFLALLQEAVDIAINSNSVSSDVDVCH